MSYSLCSFSKQPVKYIRRLHFDALGGAGCPFSSLSHIGSVKYRMKGLDLLYFCQVNKSCCLGCSLTLFVIKCEAWSSLQQTQSDPVKAQNL